MNPHPTVASDISARTCCVERGPFPTVSRTAERAGGPRARVPMAGTCGKRRRFTPAVTRHVKRTWPTRSLQPEGRGPGESLFWGHGAELFGFFFSLNLGVISFPLSLRECRRQSSQTGARTSSCPLHLPGSGRHTTGAGTRSPHGRASSSSARGHVLVASCQAEGGLIGRPVCFIHSFIHCPLWGEFLLSKTQHDSLKQQVKVTGIFATGNSRQSRGARCEALDSEEDYHLGWWVEGTGSKGAVYNGAVGCILQHGPELSGVLTCSFIF